MTPVLVVALLVGACGGSTASEGGRRSEGRSGGSTTTVEGGGKADDSKGSTATTARPSGDPGKQPTGSSGSNDGGTSGEGDTSSSTTERPKEPLPIELSLKSSCVQAGGQQTITVKVPPGSGVAYDSHYSDGKTGLSEGFYGGNNGAVVTSEDGTWSDTWVISPSAPPGKVRVAVLAGHMDYQHADKSLYFDLVPPTGTCP